MGIDVVFLRLFKGGMMGVVVRVDVRELNDIDLMGSCVGPAVLEILSAQFMVFIF